MSDANGQRGLQESTARPAPPTYSAFGILLLMAIVLIYADIVATVTRA